MSEDKNVNKTSTSRRNVLKSIGAGGVLAGAVPGSWTKPVVNAVILPVHAQTSVCGSPGPCQGDMSVNILAAVRPEGDNLFIIGEAQIPAGSACFIDESKSIECDIIHDGVTIGHEENTSAGSCSVGSASGCLVSCSVVVDASDNTTQIGDCVTLKITFNGTCICSATATVI